MGIMNTVREGADLTHPKVSGGWIVGAIIAVTVLMAVVAVAGYLYRSATGVTKVVTNGAANTVNAIGKAFGTGA